jgi:hypothetical protein
VTIALSDPRPHLWRVLTTADVVLSEANNMVESGALDEVAAQGLMEAHHRLLCEAGSVLDPELLDELHRVVMPFENHELTPSEVVFAQAQLVGWLTGLIEGLRLGLTHSGPRV